MARPSVYRISLAFVWSDFKRPYANFLHWTRSKLAILSYAALCSFVVGAPLGLLCWWLGQGVLADLPKDSLSAFVGGQGVSSDLSAWFVGHAWAIATMLVAGLLIVAACVFFCAYGYFLLLNVYAGYAKNRRLPVKANLYFAWRKMGRFLGVGARLVFPFVPPFAWIGPFLLWIAAWVAGFFCVSVWHVVDAATPPYWFSAMTGLPVLWILARAYIRLPFAFGLLLEDSENRLSTKEIVRESLRMTKGKQMTVVGLMLPFLLGVAIVGAGLAWGEERLRLNRFEQRIDAAAQADPAGFVNDHEYVKKHFVSPLISQQDALELARIDASYPEETNGIGPDYLLAVGPYLEDPDGDDAVDTLRETIFGAIEFLLLDGLMAMVYYSVFTLLDEGRKQAADDPSDEK